MVSTRKPTRFLDIIKERNKREEGTQEITSLDMLRNRRRIVKNRKTREALTSLLHKPDNSQ